MRFRRARPTLPWCEAISATCHRRRPHRRGSRGSALDHAAGTLDRRPGGSETRHRGCHRRRDQSEDRQRPDEYDLGRAHVRFRDLAPPEVRRAVKSREVRAILVVVPLTEKYLSLVRGLFPKAVRYLFRSNLPAPSPRKSAPTKASMCQKARCVAHRRSRMTT
jgi:hypothetical protein